MSEPDWFMNLIIWWVYNFLQGIVIQWIGWFFAIFSDWGWGNKTMVGLHGDLAETGTWLANAGPEIEKGDYGA